MELKLTAIVALVALTAIILIRKNRAKEIRRKMVSCIGLAMGYYERDYPNSFATAMPIFVNSLKFAEMLNYRTLRKSMAGNNVNEELGALNIIQNFAMAELEREMSVTEYLTTTEEIVPKDCALTVYNYINEYKYKNNYIAYSQYIDNQKLGEKLAESPYQFRTHIRR